MHNTFIPGGITTGQLSTADYNTLVANNSPGYILSYVAGGTNNYVTLAGANPTQLAGVSDDKPWGTSISYGYLGQRKVLTGGVINVGDTVTSDATSRAVTVYPSASGHVQIVTLGVALDSATAAGQYITVRLSLDHAEIL
jgi:hypothetical protein